MSASCQNCKFVLRETPRADPVCRRYPPQLLMVLARVQNALGRAEEKPQLQSTLPIVADGFWCGEYQEASRIVVAQASTEPNRVDQL